MNKTGKLGNIQASFDGGMDSRGNRVNRSPTPLGEWLKEICSRQGMSLRQVAGPSNLSHGTIADIMNGARPSPATVRKLAERFAGKGYERLALEDKLLVLAGYRTERPQGQDLSQALARVIDKVSRLCEPQLSLMMRFAEFLAEADRQLKGGDD